MGFQLLPVSMILNYRNTPDTTLAYVAFSVSCCVEANKDRAI